MPTFTRCDETVNTMAAAILCEFETHKPLLDARVKIDYVFALPDCDDVTGKPKNDAIAKGGVKCLSLCRKLQLKDRAMGRGDAEITLDEHWWQEAGDAERRALLDHELHHIAVKFDKRGLVKDALGRPVLQMRKHDYEFGWFKVVGARHGKLSMERMQAAQIMCDAGQYFWPDIAATQTI